MADEDKQTDGDSIELSTVVQLGPHASTDKVSVVARDEEGTEYVSLDEVYEVTGQESIQILAANCRQYLQTERLHPAVFSALKIGGMEGLVPGYDRFNAYKGAESFLSALKAGFVTIIKAVKRFVIAVIDWVILKVKTLLGFEKTEKELKIVAELSDDVKKDLAMVLGNVAGSEPINLDVEELYAALPGNLSSIEAFTIVQNKNKSAMDQIESLTKASKALEEAEDEILKAGSLARQSRGRYQAAAAKLRKAFADKESFSTADVIEFRAVLDDEVANNLNPAPLRDKLVKLLDEIYGIDLGNVGLDKGFKDNLRQQREQLSAMSSVKVSENDYERVRKSAKLLPRILLRASRDRFDEATLSALKDVIDVKDAELIERVDAVFENVGVLKMSYTSYSASISEYTAALEYLITVTGQIRRSIAGIINWTNKVDKLMLAYISKDLKTMIAAEQEVLNEKAQKAVGEFNDKGEQYSTSMNVNYDNLFINAHPTLGMVLMSQRARYDEIKKNYKIIDRINAGLKVLGVNNRI